MSIKPDFTLVADNSRNPDFRKTPSRGFTHTLHQNFALMALPKAAPDYTGRDYSGWGAELFSSDLYGSFTMLEGDTFDFSGFKSENPFPDPHI